MYRFTSSDLARARSTPLFHQAAALMYTISVDLSDTFYRGEASILAELSSLDPSHYYTQVGERYPMAYFMALEDEEATRRWASTSLSALRQQTQQLRQTVQALRAQWTARVDDVDSDTYLRQHLQGELSLLHLDIDGIRSQTNYIVTAVERTVDDLAEREALLANVISFNDPLWWTWLHHCLESSIIMMPAILQALAPTMTLYICESRSHVWCTNVSTKSEVEVLVQRFLRGETAQLNEPALFDLSALFYGTDDDRNYVGPLSLTPLADRVQAYLNRETHETYESVAAAYFSALVGRPIIYTPDVIPPPRSSV